MNDKESRKRKLTSQYFIESTTCKDLIEHEAMRQKYLKLFKEENIDSFLDDEYMDKARADLINPDNWSSNDH